MRISFHRRVRLSGFSLIELIIFIGILAIALTSITLVYINTTRNSADPLMRIRSIELAKSTMEEILVKAYDENTPLGGGCVSYSVAGTSTCVAGPKAPVASTALTAEEVGPASIRGTFDDVDDYNNLAYCGAGGVPDPSCTNPCINMVNESGESIKNDYAGYAICIKVSFAGGPATPPVKEINNVTPTPPAVTVPLNDAKRIDVIVTDPLRSKISLTAYRLNY